MRIGGVVLNYENGTVETNNGEVYNYGGTVTTNVGTEFFSMKIVNESTVTTQYGNGFTQKNDDYWLGTNGTTKTTGTVVITPKDGYEIKDIQPSGNLKEATKNADGSWTLIFESGTNTAFNVDTAKKPDNLAAVTVSGQDNDQHSDQESKPQPNNLVVVTVSGQDNDTQTVAYSFDNVQLSDQKTLTVDLRINHSETFRADTLKGFQRRGIKTVELLTAYGSFRIDMETLLDMTQNAGVTFFANGTGVDIFADWKIVTTLS